MTMERGLSFGSRGPQSDFARLCWRVRIQNNNHQRHATTQGVSHAAVKHPARFRGLRAPHALYCAHQPNSAVKPTPTSSACGCPPCFALRRGLPRALACLLFLPISAHEYHSTTYLHDTRLAGGGTTQRPDRWHHTRCASANLRLATHLPLCVG